MKSLLSYWLSARSPGSAINFTFSTGRALPYKHGCTKSLSVLLIHNFSRQGFALQPSRYEVPRRELHGFRAPSSLISTDGARTVRKLYEVTLKTFVLQNKPASPDAAWRIPQGSLNHQYGAPEQISICVDCRRAPSRTNRYGQSAIILPQSGKGPQGGPANCRSALRVD